MVANYLYGNVLKSKSWPGAYIVFYKPFVLNIIILITYLHSYTNTILYYNFYYTIPQVIWIRLYCMLYSYTNKLIYQNIVL